MRGILAHGDSCVDKPPHVFQDPCILPRLLRLGLGYHPIEVCEDSNLSFQGGSGQKGRRIRRQS